MKPIHKGTWGDASTAPNEDVRYVLHLLFVFQGSIQTRIDPQAADGEGGVSERDRGSLKAA
jgi:hypothetical protein